MSAGSAPLRRSTGSIPGSGLNRHIDFHLGQTDDPRFGGPNKRLSTSRNARPSDRHQAMTSKKRRSLPFLEFCDLVLNYENYHDLIKPENRRKRHSSSPIGSTGSSSGSWAHSKEEDSDSRGERTSEENDDTVDDRERAMEGDVEDEDDDDGWDTVTCFCGKPFAGRPMIECSGCLTWVHLRCARLRRTHIPDVWYCSSCKMRGPAGGVKAATAVTATNNKSRKGSINRNSQKATLTVRNRVEVAKEEQEKLVGSRKRKASLRRMQSTKRTKGHRDEILSESVSEEAGVGGRIRLASPPTSGGNRLVALSPLSSPSSTVSTLSSDYSSSEGSSRSPTKKNVIDSGSKKRGSGSGVVVTTASSIRPGSKKKFEGVHAQNKEPINKRATSNSR